MTTRGARRAAIKGVNARGMSRCKHNRLHSIPAAMHSRCGSAVHQMLSHAGVA